MIFHEIEHLSEVLNNHHRLIMYYIDEGTTSISELRNYVESILEMLRKKNDDLVVIKVCKNSHQFIQFTELYKPEINAPIALFIINTEGLPLICEQVFENDNIYTVFDSICSYCQLNSISQSEIAKVIKDSLSQQYCNSSPVYESAQPIIDPSLSIIESGEEFFQTTTTVLQIRLPDGTKENQKFSKHAFLQEVYDFISLKFNMNDFDLKTYNRNVFSAADYEKTLEHLDLIPNGVIIVVFKNSFTNNGVISRMIQFGFGAFFLKFTSIFQYVQGLLYNFWNMFFSSGTRRSSEVDSQTTASQSGGKKSMSRVKKAAFGNIHTLRRNDDSDDENNRYNGNSTQQK